MAEGDAIPEIETLFGGSDIVNERYRELIPLTLRKVLPSGFFESSIDDTEEHEEQRKRFQSLLPLFTHSGFKPAPFNLSFFLLVRYRTNAVKFFFEMISRWLIPGRRVNILMLYAVDFRFPKLGGDIYSLCEVMINLDNEGDSEEMQRNLPIIETEIKLGVGSVYYAKKILEIKGLKADEKTAMIQEHIAHLVHRIPKDFDTDVFTEMQHVLVTCRDGFKAARESRHISRIISVHYLFRRALRDAVEGAPRKRHLRLKLIKTRVHLPKGMKTVLGVIVGINFLKDNEVFEERHLLKAIRTYVPNVHAVEGSFFQNARGSENITTMYLEVEKTDGTLFTSEEICRLRRELPSDLKDRIEHLIHPIFMPRNEEEIMRNILSLSGQVKYLRDIPQIILTFDEQTHGSLFFTVILMRVLRPDDQPIQRLFQQADTPLEYVHDRVKVVGHIRKKYPKEATVFRVKLPKERFLRGDHSIDLYRARRFVVDELARILGDVRDYNGGMISKQNEVLGEVSSLLMNEGKYSDFLLENLFYSLTPSIMRNVLEPEPLKTLFLMLLEATERRQQDLSLPAIRLQSQGDYVMAMITADASQLKEKIGRALSKLSIPATDLATAFLTVYETPCLGYIYRADNEEKQHLFKSVIEQFI